jgi:flagellar export protein FliJ
MPFRFPLQAVLRFRESFEHRERLRLQVITREVVKARQESEDLKQERAAAAKRLSENLGQGITGAELQFEIASDRSRLRRMAIVDERIAKLEALRIRQLAEFRKAQQQRKILENLRDRQLAAYRVDQDRRTQQQLDERFLILRGGHVSG